MATVIDLTSLPSADGAKVVGEASRSGFAVSKAGDFNNDGIDDIIIGAWSNSAGGSNAGAAYVVFGKPGGFTSVNLANIAAADGFRILGNGAFDWTGYSVAGIGDYNGDGIDDVMVGAPQDDTDAVTNDTVGRAFIIFGKTSGFGQIDVSTLTAADGFSITGDATNDQAALDVAAAGDINNDGLADVLVSAQFGESGLNNQGEVYVVFGKAGAGVNLDLTNFTAADGFVLRGVAASDALGSSIKAAGDVNGDGIDDIIVGAHLNDAGGISAGAAYVVFGRTTGFGASVNLATLTSTTGFVIQGDAAGDEAGYTVSGAGDVNGDGFDDVLVGDTFAAGTGADPGRVWVLFGKASGFGPIDLSNLAASAGFLISGNGISNNPAATATFARSTVGAAGDVNNDGYGDIIIGAFLDDAGGVDAGAAYVIYGKGQGFGPIDLNTLADNAGFKIQGDSAGDNAGRAVSAAGDLNGDGFADVIVGAPTENNSYIVYGKATTFVFNTITGTAIGETLTGTTGADYILGGGGNDLLIGGGRNDRLYGEAGNDIIRPGSGADIVYGGDGIDTLDYSDATGAIVASIANRQFYETTLTTGTAASVAGATLDQGYGIENVIGTRFGDRIYGDAGDNVFQPGAGNDIIYGGGAVTTDTASYVSATGAIFVDILNNRVFESNVTTGTITGGFTLVSTDLIYGISSVRGSEFGDRLYGDGGGNIIDGGAGDDIIYGLGGSDTITGGSGNDFIIGGAGGDTLAGGNGADRFYFLDVTDGVDTIADFAIGIDDLYFNVGIFGGVAGGTATLVIDGPAVAANSFLYNSVTGLLSFDADGAGGNSAAEIAMLTPGLALTTGDLVLYA